MEAVVDVAVGCKVVPGRTEAATRGASGYGCKGCEGGWAQGLSAVALGVLGNRGVRTLYQCQWRLGWKPASRALAPTH